MFRGRHKETGDVVAIKQMKFSINVEGAPATAMREISNMSQLDHKHIARSVESIINTMCAELLRPNRLRDKFYTREGTLHLVMEFLDIDLHRQVVTSLPSYLIPLGAPE